jgi:xanthine dehydrogenase accessory factor
VKGAGDLATGVALSLRAAGFMVVMTELAQPTAIRLTVSFANAVYVGVHEVEGVRAERADMSSWKGVLDAGSIPVLVDPGAEVLLRVTPVVVVDAIMAKANTGTAVRDGAAVIALGPGFTAGQDADAVIETMRGHELGRVIRVGSAALDTGVPGVINGQTADRVLRAPRGGRVAHEKGIGDAVDKGDVVMRVDGEAVTARIAGSLRGLIHQSVVAARGMKIGDVDPRGDPRYVHTVSDKAHAVGRAALEAALCIGRERQLFQVRV